MGAFQPKPQLSFQGERWWETGSGIPQDVGGITFGKPVNVGGDLYQGNNATGQVRKLDNAPKVSVQANSLTKGVTAGMEAAFKSAAKRVEQFGDIANASRATLENLAEMKRLDAGGIYSNVTTGPATWFANFAQSLGMNLDPAKLGRTEAYNAAAIDLWQSKIAGMEGGNRGVTKEEAAEIKNLLPQTAHSPEARQRIMAMMENVAKRSILRHENAQKAFHQAAQADDARMLDSIFTNVHMPAPVTPEPTTEKPGFQPSTTRKGIRIIGVTQ